MARSVKSCCYTFAVDPDAGFCGDCGSPLLRCMAAADCKGLVNADGLCDTCVSPQLFLDKGAVREVKVGGAVVLPLLFRNNAPAGRPIFISNLRLREGSGERKLQELPWERLESGVALPWSAQTSPIEHSGRMKLEISYEVATRYRWRQERFLYVAAMDIVADRGGDLVINQTNNTAEGATTYAPIRLTLGESNGPSSSTEPAPLALVRADAMERAEGIRGVQGGPVVQRGARLIWKGFAPGEAPADGPIMTSDGMLALGRAPTRRQGGTSDAQLLVRDDDGNLDEAASARISRRHVDLFVQDGRLWLHAAGQAGVRVGDRVVARDLVTAIGDGDVIDMLPRERGAISLSVRMVAHNGIVDEIVLKRSPGNFLEKRR
jgi:hypothetical protein